MRHHSVVPVGIVMLSSLLLTSPLRAEIKVVSQANRGDAATPEFKFTDVSAPASNDAAAQAKFTVVDGRRDVNGGGVGTLNDGYVPGDADAPRENFFFAEGTDGGRLLVDLGSTVDIQRVNTFSWHRDKRGPQVYRLYASDGTASGFLATPTRDIDPMTCGWIPLAAVDTRPPSGRVGGQYGVSISDADGLVGRYRYLLFDLVRTQQDDPFGNTFLSEVDVIDRLAPPPMAFKQRPGQTSVEAGDGQYQIVIDTSETPDLTSWVETELVPVVQQWYPKIVELLPSEGYVAPSKVTIQFSKDMRGVAATGGTRVTCAADWFRQQLQGEAKGAVVHELVHVVQQYGRARGENRNVTRTPGWLVEGIADYVRWFLYEPQSQGADIGRRNLDRARYDASYRVSANFLNWVTVKYPGELVPKLNAAAREGRYRDELWQQLTGKTVQELGDQWKADLQLQLTDEARGDR